MRVEPPLLLSDHSLIVGPGQPVVHRRPHVQRRCWKRFDVDAFTADLLESDLVVSPPVDVSELLSCYNTTLTRLVTCTHLRHVILATHCAIANDMQGTTGRGKPCRVNEVATKLEVCVLDVSIWCAAKRLQLNNKKIEVMWLCSATNLGKLSSADQHLHVGPDNVSPSTVVRDMGDFFDCELTMKSHISRITSACFYQLRRLRAVRKSQEVTGSL